MQITINHTKQIEKERVKTTRPTKKKIFIYVFIYLLNRIKSSTIREKKINPAKKRHTFEEALTNVCKYLYFDIQQLEEVAGFIKSKCKDNHKVKSTVEIQTR